MVEFDQNFVAVVQFRHVRKNIKCEQVWANAHKLSIKTCQKDTKCELRCLNSRQRLDLLEKRLDLLEKLSTTFGFIRQCNVIKNSTGIDKSRISPQDVLGTPSWPSANEFQQKRSKKSYVIRSNEEKLQPGMIYIEDNTQRLSKPN